jgi:hypothetical protein
MRSSHGRRTSERRLTRQAPDIHICGQKLSKATVKLRLLVEAA